MAPPFRTAECDILYGEGISRESSLLDLAVEQDVIHKSGAWFSYGDQRIGQGRDAVRRYMKENPEFYDEIDRQMRAIYFSDGKAAAATGEGFDVEEEI